LFPLLRLRPSPKSGKNSEFRALVRRKRNRSDYGIKKVAGKRKDSEIPPGWAAQMGRDENKPL
jgi:hypothetical protein